MRAKNIEKGGEYWTKVGEGRVKVRVVYIRSKGTGFGSKSRYQVERVDNGKLLPKFRSAQALHPTGRGEWPGVMQRQEGSTVVAGDLKRGLRIVNRDHPEWGTWVVQDKYDEGIWEIRSNRGFRVLNEGELRFWALA